jgi:hypothetical protein
MDSRKAGDGRVFPAFLARNGELGAAAHGIDGTAHVV